MLYLLDNIKNMHKSTGFCYLLNNKMNSLAEIIQKRLTDLDISKSDLARKMGVSRSYVVNMANETGNTRSGQYRPLPEVTAQMAKHLQISQDEILQAVGYELSGIILSETEKAALELFKYLPPHQQETIKTLMRDLGKKVEVGDFPEDVVLPKAA
jgi:transcriptional regulator with XRE-family HTH domain